MKKRGKEVWGILWRSKNRLDGEQEHLMWDAGHPSYCRTWAEARARIEQDYGYIRTRPDLRAEPHGWKMPLAVRAVVTFEVLPRPEKKERS